MSYKFNELRDDEDMNQDYSNNRHQESIPLSMEFQYTQKDSP